NTNRVRVRVRCQLIHQPTEKDESQQTADAAEVLGRLAAKDDCDDNKTWKANKNKWHDGARKRLPHAIRRSIYVKCPSNAEKNACASENEYSKLERFRHVLGGKNY